jgi:simple sugar transport system permease protein
MSPRARSLLTLAASAAGFVLLAAGFFLLNHQPPLALLWAMTTGAFGDAYSISETLVKTAPILLTALAATLPARLGLLSVGADGQLYLGAIAGTWLVLHLHTASAALMLPLMLVFAMAGGALWGGVAGWLRARLGVNETITTLLLNYVASLLVDYAVHGPWKDPANLGWPASPAFPPAAVLPTFFDTRAHLGIVFGVVAAIVLHVLVEKSRWGLQLAVLKSNPRAALGAGLNGARQMVFVMAIAGALAGLAGIAEASVIQGRLQSGLSLGYGYTGFLVAWLAGQNFLRVIPLSLLMGGLLASGDVLQLNANLPAAASGILQALLFIAAFAAAAWTRKR